MSILLGGCSSKLLLHAMKNPGTFEHWMLYVFLLLMVFCLITQTHFLNRGLEIGDAMALLPVFQAFWTTFGVISGNVFYRDGAPKLLGLIFMIVGVVFMLRHTNSAHKAEKLSHSTSMSIHPVDKTSVDKNDKKCILLNHDFEMERRNSNKNR
eukprot:UN30397